MVINGNSSEWKSVDAGVTKGSILGLILFILFISDINEVFPPRNLIQKHADDNLATTFASTSKSATKEMTSFHLMVTSIIGIN